MSIVNYEAYKKEFVEKFSGRSVGPLVEFQKLAEQISQNKKCENLDELVAKASAIKSSFSHNFKTSPWIDETGKISCDNLATLMGYTYFMALLPSRLDKIGKSVDFKPNSTLLDFSKDLELAALRSGSVIVGTQAPTQVGAIGTGTGTGNKSRPQTQPAKRQTANGTQSVPPSSTASKQNTQTVRNQQNSSKQCSFCSKWGHTTPNCLAKQAYERKAKANYAPRGQPASHGKAYQPRLAPVAPNPYFYNYKKLPVARPPYVCTFCGAYGHTESRCYAKGAEDLQKSYGAPAYCLYHRVQGHWTGDCARRPSDSNQSGDAYGQSPDHHR